MKNLDIPSVRGSSAIHQEILEISGADGNFRAFLEKVLLTNTPPSLTDTSALLRAINEAKVKKGKDSEETLTLQVAAYIKGVGLEWHDSATADILMGLASRFWKDRAIKAFEFLIVEVEFPIDLWRNILYLEEDFKLLGKDKEATEFPDSIEAVANRICRGLREFMQDRPPKTSPYSIYFWLNRHLAFDPAKGKTENAIIREKEVYRKILHLVLQEWVRTNLENDQEEPIYALMEWIRSRSLTDLVDNNTMEQIWTSLNSRPIKLPPYPMALKDIPRFIKALDRETWAIAGGGAFKPAGKDKQYLYDQLVHVARLCAEDRLKAKLPLSTIVNLVPLFDWTLPGYIKQWGDPDQDKLAIKLLALMRSQLRGERVEFDIFDYEYAIRVLRRSGKGATVLRQLVLAFRNCTLPCSDENTEFRQKAKSPFTRNLTPLLQAHPPEYCVSVLVDILINRVEDKDRTRSLCLDIGGFYISRLHLKKNKSQESFRKKSKHAYEESDCIEPNPFWRKAYIEALGEIGYAHDGKVLHLLDFVRKHDPDEGVRGTAHSVYRRIHRERTKDLDDLKGLRAAFWHMRIAQRRALGQPVDPDMAKLLWRQELRGETQTRSDIIYENYLGP